MNYLDYINTKTTNPKSYTSAVKFIPKAQYRSLPLVYGEEETEQSETPQWYLPSEPSYVDYTQVKLNIPRGTTTLSALNENSLKEFATYLSTKGVPVKITSLRREGAKTSNGAISRHAVGKAMDIVPESGDFSALINLLTTDKEVRNKMVELGVGFIDETTSEMLAKTGGTGPHIHIGDDRYAINYFNQFT